ncbi:hypothetical protein GCM10007898_21320 [Dyella flagellata]|uniref:Uncharacterized protein n=1 Tax=Dyella flagellata TaxID=1867833 RepID=A0ABQ5XC74_9GAMM|nr:hypothetical protein GCM10007898_21320 [Dyella flagellata]
MAQSKAPDEMTIYDFMRHHLQCNEIGVMWASGVTVHARNAAATKPRDIALNGGFIKATSIKRDESVHKKSVIAKAQGLSLEI